MIRFSLVKLSAISLTFLLFVSIFRYQIQMLTNLNYSTQKASSLLGTLSTSDFQNAIGIDTLEILNEQNDPLNLISKNPIEKALQSSNDGTKVGQAAKTDPIHIAPESNKSLAVEKPPYHYNNGAEFKMSQLVDENGKVNAAFITLARNLELFALIKAIRNVEDRFNRKFNYDWVFFNDEEFTQEFKDLTSAIVSGKTFYEKIPKEHWLYPDFVDQEKAAESRKQLKEQGVIYGELESYRHMCRFESGFFWQSKALESYEWYWRVEPGIEIHCDLNYDVFKFMQDNQKVYGLVITIFEFEATIPTLWEKSKKFMQENPSVVATNNAMRFLSEDGDKYNLCHYWSNFEVANLNFWRSKAYHDYFNYLDSTGGFFYERWGDAPIHSIAASLFLSKDKIHFFNDVGYSHGPYTACPIDDEFRYKHKCTCSSELDFTFRGYSCGKLFHDVFNIERPAKWEKFT